MLSARFVAFVVVLAPLLLLAFLSLSISVCHSVSGFLTCFSSSHCHCLSVSQSLSLSECQSPALPLPNTLSLLCFSRALSRLLDLFLSRSPCLALPLFLSPYHAHTLSRFPSNFLTLAHNTHTAHLSRRISTERSVFSLSHSLLFLAPSYPSLPRPISSCLKHAHTHVCGVCALSWQGICVRRRFETCWCVFLISCWNAMLSGECKGACHNCQSAAMLNGLVLAFYYYCSYYG